MDVYKTFASVRAFRSRKRKHPGKPGRPPTGQMARTKPVQAMFTPDEYAQLKLEAEAQNMTVSGLVWARATGRR